MLEEFVATLPKRDIKLTSYTRQGEAPVTHLQIGEASAKIDAARFILEKACREMDEWAATGDYMPKFQRAAICRDTAFADRLCGRRRPAGQRGRRLVLHVKATYSTASGRT